MDHRASRSCLRSAVWDYFLQYRRVVETRTMVISRDRHAETMVVIRWGMLKIPGTTHENIRTALYA